MSRGAVTIAGFSMIICGFIPKIGAIISAMLISVLGGGVMLMFGMVVSAGINMLSDVNWSLRNMVTLATSIAVGLSVQAVPKSTQHLPGLIEMLAISELLPVALLAVVMNMFLPQDDDSN